MIVGEHTCDNCGFIETTIPLPAGFSPEFIKYPKIPRWSRNVIITEKIDGMNGQILITAIPNDYTSPTLIAYKKEADSACAYGTTWGMFVGSRNRLLTLNKSGDTHGFAAWCKERAEAVFDKLGPGRHFGEFWGKGINRNYGLDHNRFSLFRRDLWEGKELPPDFYVVPKLGEGLVHHNTIYIPDICLNLLISNGSYACKGYMDPEGVVIFHTASGHLYKKYCKNDEDATK